MNATRILIIMGDSAHLVGAILIAYAALRVNDRFRHEHKVDDRVFAEMTREHRLATIGVALMVLGFLLRLGGTLVSDALSLV